MKIAVVGGGIFGMTIASVLAKEGFQIDLYEKEDDVFKAASGINQYRLHRGYHYPRSIETIKDCISGELQFRKFYPEVVIDAPHEHYYAIAKEKSFLNAEQCFKIWSRYGLEYKEANLDLLNPDAIEKCVRVKESIIDPIKFKEVCIERCLKYGVNIILNKEVGYEDLYGYDLIVGATYANSNVLLKALPEAQKNYQFELIEKLVLKVPERFKNMSVVIQDGPFTCIDPYGKTGLSLMGSVTRAIHHSKIGKNMEIPKEYKDLVNKGIIQNPKITKVDSFLEDAEFYFPGIKDEVEHFGSMFTIRTVLPYREHDDARPTIVEEINNRLIIVFSGKIPTCVDVAEQVLKIVKRKQVKEKKQINLAIIGIGRWGRNLIRNFNEIANIKVCVNRGNESEIDYINKNYPNIKTSCDYDDVLNDDSIDAVVIATPIDTHYEIAKKAISKGKKVFLEKPMASNLKEAKELIEIGKGKIFFIGHIFLYGSCYSMLKELVFGDPVVDLEFNWNKFGTFGEDIFLNLVSQDLSVVMGLLEKIPERVMLKGDKSIISNSNEVSLELEFDQGENCKININRANPQKRKEVKITTKSGKVYYWIDDKIMRLNKEKESFDILFDSGEEPLKKEAKKFLRHIEDNQEPIINKSIALNVMKVLDMINKEKQASLESKPFK